MADYFGSAQTADRPTSGERQPAGQAKQHACGIEVAGTGGVDDPGNRRGRDYMRLIVRNYDTAGCAAGQRGDLDVAPCRGERHVEILGLVERADLGFVREQNIHLSSDELAELVAVTADAKRIGEAQRDQPPGFVRNRSRLAKRCLRAGRIEQIAFEVGYLRGADGCRIDVLGTEIDT